MKLPESVAATGLAMSLALTGCSSNPEGYVDNTTLSQHNEALHAQRYAAYEQLTTDITEVADKITPSTPELKGLKKLIVKGFEYTEPGNYLASPDTQEGKKIRLVPYMPDDSKLEYPIFLPFQGPGAAVYIDTMNTIAVSTEYPEEIQVSNMIHELTHGVQDEEGINDENCEVREPDALLSQAITFPEVFSPEIVAAMDKVAEQAVITDDTIDFGDISAVMELVDNYSDSEKVRNMFSMLTNHYVALKAFEMRDPATAQENFKLYVTNNYCESVGDSLDEALAG